MPKAGDFSAASNFAPPGYAGDAFTITATVPEPSTTLLMLPMLCLAGLMATRRREHR